MPAIKVLTINIHKGFTIFNRRFILKELRDAVRTIGADIVLLQEVMGESLLRAHSLPDWPNNAHYEFLADTIWPHFAYGRNAVYPQGHHGNALLSKLPITQYQNLDITAQGDEQRGLLHSTIQTDAGTLHVICVHFGLREAHRKAQLNLLCNAIVEHVPSGAPLIVGGDFNDWRQQIHRPLIQRTGLTEVFIDTFGKAAKTFPAHWPLLCLDRIYIRDAQLHRPMVLPRRPWSHLSDHVPLLAELQF